MQLNTTTLGVISNIGASKLDLAITLAENNCALDAAGDELAYIDLAEEGMLDILFLGGVLSSEEHESIENSKTVVSVLLLTA